MGYGVGHGHGCAHDGDDNNDRRNLIVALISQSYLSSLY